MLISFSVANFRSFAGKQTLDLTLEANPKKPHLHNIFKTNNKQIPKLLKSAVLYGANASGKSNLIKAFYYCAVMILDKSRQRGDKIKFFDPFSLDDKSNFQPTEYEIDFIASNSIRYIYSFGFDEKQIHYEKLEYYKNEKNSTKQLIYQIGFNQEQFDNNFSQQTDFFNSINIETFENTKNNLFLNLSINSGNSSLNPVYDWFKNYAEAMFEHDDHDLDSFLWLKETENKKKLLEIIKKFDLAITDIDIIETEIDLPLYIKEDQNIPQEIKNKLRKRIIPFFVHKTTEGKEIKFKTKQISEGTLNLITIVPQLLQIFTKGGILFFDELDRSIHPDILVELIKMFHNPQYNTKNAQLIFTAHNDILLDKEYNLFDNHQVWFVSKDDANQSSQLYCLQQFEKTKNITASYRNHQYGARPYISR